MLNALSETGGRRCCGLLAIGVGILAWTRPEVFWVSLVLVFGVYAVVDGVFAIVAAITGETRDRALHFLEGVLGIVVGVIVFVYPDQAEGNRARNRARGRRYRRCRDNFRGPTTPRDRRRVAAGIGLSSSIILE